MRPISRRNWARLAFLTFGAVAAWLALAEGPSPADGAVQYTITDLGTLGKTSYGGGINASGQVVGYWFVNAIVQHGFLWTPGGGMQDLGTLGGQNSLATGINASGQVVGYSTAIPGVLYHAFLYENGQMTDLGTLGTQSTLAYALNASGQVVGGGRTYLPSDSPHAFLYENGQFKDLGTVPGDSESAAKGINASGQIVGSSGYGGSPPYQHAFLYSGGQMIALPGLGGLWDNEAVGINDLGLIVGASETSDNAAIHAVLWTAQGAIQDLGTLGYDVSFASGINNHGQIVGNSDVFINGLGIYHAFIFNGGVMLDLNDLIDPTTGWILTHAEGINDSGQVVGYGTNPLGQTHAYLLTPVPEPGILAFLVFGVLGFIGCRIRRQLRPFLKGQSP